MSKAADKSSQGFHFLGLCQLFLDLFPFLLHRYPVADIPGYADNTNGIASFIYNS